MKLKSRAIQISCDGGAATGKSTGAKMISEKYNLKFLSSGLLYRYASHKVLKHKPKNQILFLKKCFKNLNLKKLNNKNLHLPKISAHASIIAKKQGIRKILKEFQKKFAKKNNKVCIEGRDIGTVILPNADIKFFFKCNLETAARRRFRELKETNKKITFNEVKKAMRIRDNLDKKRKNSPLIQAKNAVIVHTDKLKNIKGMLNKMSEVIERKIKNKNGH